MAHFGWSIKEGSACLQNNAKISIVNSTTLSIPWTLEMPGLGLAIVHLVANAMFALVGNGLTPM